MEAPDSRSELRRDRAGIVLASLVGTLIGGLCCFTPVVMVLLGISTVAAANELGNNLYGEHRWIFRAAGLISFAVALVVYFRSRGICTLDEAKRQRNRILNVITIALTAAIGGYLLWTYVAVHWWGVEVGLPWRQYDESWAIAPGVLVLLGAGALYVVLSRRRRAAAADAHPTHPAV